MEPFYARVNKRGDVLQGNSLQWFRGRWKTILREVISVDKQKIRLLGLALLSHQLKSCQRGKSFCHFFCLQKSIDSPLFLPNDPQKLKNTFPFLLQMYYNI